MKWIKVTIECYSKDNMVTPDLEDAGVLDETDWRECFVNIENLTAFYTDVMTGGTHLSFDNDQSWLIKESINDVFELLKNPFTT